MVELLRRRGFELKARRWRTPFAEIDLLFFHESQGWWMVEVKSWKHLAPEDLLSSPQEMRLRRAAEFVSHQVGQVPRLMLAAVNHLGQVELIPIE